MLTNVLRLSEVFFLLLPEMQKGFSLTFNIFWTIFMEHFLWISDKRVKANYTILKGKYIFTAVVTPDDLMVFYHFSSLLKWPERERRKISSWDSHYVFKMSVTSTCQVAIKILRNGFCRFSCRLASGWCVKHRKSTFYTMFYV